MGDNVFSPDNIMFFTSSDPMMDLDDLLIDGCWFGTQDESDFLNRSPSDNAPFDPSFIWTTLEDDNYKVDGSSSKQNTPEERQLGENSAKIQCQGEDSVNALECSSQAENQLVENLELSRRWWIGPSPNHGLAMSVMEKLIQALEYFNGLTGERDVLLQIWVPVNRGSRRVLSTSGQPFSLDLNYPNLANYRNISEKYQFSAEEDSKEDAGLPSRVFMGKVPEWTPDVRLFRKEEYARVGHAQEYDVRGTLAVPVFNQGSNSCLGVIEVVTTSQKINYKPELESVCRALEAVDLRGSEIASAHSVKISDGSYQAALPEILEVLKSACETNRLPLAQTWISCVQQGKEGCRHSDENLVHCVSTVDSACYIAEPSTRGFHEACSEHHLLKGQGVVGRAFMTNEPCFYSNVTSLSKTEYPLSHHARMFNLCAAVAIRLRSIYTGTADFVLEFFLPMDCRDPEEQKKLLNSLSIVIQNVCQTLRIVTDTELQEEKVSNAKEIKVPSEGRLNRNEMTEPETSAKFSHEISHGTSTDMDTLESDDVAQLFPQEKPRDMLAEDAMDPSQYQQNSSGGNDTLSHKYFDSGRCGSLDVGKTREKRRVKAEKHITLEMLRQYFAGSLKDAAKSIGVCPTTLKRICRQHGISRWPSRTIKKVGYSLQKIQGVIDTVQGTSSFEIKSFYSNFPELASPNISRTSPISDSKSRVNQKSLNSRTEHDTSSPEDVASKSPSSSCSLSSNSSQCCSSGTQPQLCTLNTACHEDSVVMVNPCVSVLKRARSHAELHALSDEAPKVLPKSQSHRDLFEHPKSEYHPTLPKNTSGSRSTPEGDTYRVKVAYGEEKVRFRMLNTSGYKDLWGEIAKRFRIDDKSKFHLKYLDDDSEWVLLTCSDDLEECLDVCRLTQNHTVKLSIHPNLQQHSA